MPLAGRLCDGAEREGSTFRSGPPRRVRCVLLPDRRRECRRRQVAKARMRPHFVIVLPPRLDHRLRLGPRPEPFEAQAFVAELAVEAFYRSILPGLARIDQRSFDALVHDPFQESAGDKFWTVVRAQI